MSEKWIILEPKYKLIIFSFVAILMTGCDPPHYIKFINNSDSIAKVKLNLNSGIEDFGYQDIITGDSIVFNLKQKETTNIHFGIGDWSDGEIDRVTGGIKSIEIETRDIKTVYKTKNSMKRILENNRHGFWFKTSVEIEIK